MTSKPPVDSDRAAESPVETARDNGSVRGYGNAVFRAIYRRFSVDTRALAAVRIALGCTILIDLLHRAGSLELFYTDAGVYPIAVYETTYTQYSGLSFHALSGDLWLQQLLFVIAGLFAIAFIVGYRTRTVGLISLLLLISLHARNPAVLNGGDRLFRVLLLVALASPLGERWSIDALRRGHARHTVASFATAALLLQPLAVFSANAVLKHEGSTWFAGEALGIAMANDVMTIYLGNVIAQYPTLLTALTYGWVVLLSGSILFLLVPIGWPRTIAALAYISAFVGMALSMMVGLFPLVLTAAVLPYLGSGFWDVISRRIPDRVSEWELDDSRLSAPPIERRALSVLRDRGHGNAADYAVSYGQSLLTVIGVLLVVWIVAFTAIDVTEADVPAEVDSPHLDQQSWGLYAPNPSQSYSWFVIEAEFANGSTAEALNGGEPDFDRPPDASKKYDSFRERKYLETVRDSAYGEEYGTIAIAYGEWACREAKDTHGSSVERIVVYRMYEESPVGGEYEEDLRQLTLIEMECSA